MPNKKQQALETAIKQMHQIVKEETDKKIIALDETFQKHFEEFVTNAIENVPARSRRSGQKGS